MLRQVHPDDASSICIIYNHFIEDTAVTFEESILTPEEMRQRILETTPTYPWLVREERGKLAGYAYGRKWRERSAYRHSAEVTVYLDPSAVGKGIGTELFGALLTELRSREIHCVIGGVALPNAASVALLEKFGLRKVAHFKEVGYKLGRWIDVGYWQIVF